MPGVVDSHVHAWELASEGFPWHADLGVTADTAEPIEGLVASMDADGVEAAVLVQSSMYGFDHAYVAHALAREPQRLRGVALVDPLDPTTPDAVRRLAGRAPVTGLRMIPLRADRAWFGDRAAAIWEVAGELGLAMTFLVAPRHLESVGTWARRFPNVDVVIEHLGRPDLAEAGGDAIAGVLRLADIPSSHVKVSGIGGLSKQPRPHRDVWPWVQRVVRAYGPQRVVWGSDYPWVKSLNSTMGESLESTRLAVADWGPEDQAAILGGTAARLFRFEVGRLAAVGTDRP